METLVVAIIFIVGGSIGTYYGFIFQRKNSKTTREGIKTEATIAYYVKKSDADEDFYYYPVLRFKNLKGEVINHQSNYGKTWAEDNVGSKVEVFYLFENNKYEVITDTNFYRNILPKLVISLGLFFVIAGILLLMRNSNS